MMMMSEHDYSKNFVISSIGVTFFLVEYHFIICVLNSHSKQNDFLFFDYFISYLINPSFKRKKADTASAADILFKQSRKMFVFGSL